MNETIQTPTSEELTINAEIDRIGGIIGRLNRDAARRKGNFPDLACEAVFNLHANLLVRIADEVCLKPQNRKFKIDEYNKDILRFLLYYFNECPLAETVFPDKKYRLEKNLLIMGKVGVGKTLLMQVFSEYLKCTNNPNFFYNLSVTQMVNYYTIHNNLDRYTYNEENSVGFKPAPVNVCLNDIGIEGKKHYGQDTKALTADFIHARNEIWTMTAPGARKFAHLTTNLTKRELEEEFKDGFGRIVDRFKTYNILELRGTSRR